jgi:hypothetical protein
VQIGEERMLYLLSCAAIFVSLPNHCLLQVAGHSFSIAASNTKQIPLSISITRESQHEHLTRASNSCATRGSNGRAEYLSGDKNGDWTHGERTRQCLVDFLASQPEI